MIVQSARQDSLKRQGMSIIMDSKTVTNTLHDKGMNEGMLSVTLKLDKQNLTIVSGLHVIEVFGRVNLELIS